MSGGALNMSPFSSFSLLPRLSHSLTSPSPVTQRFWLVPLLAFSYEGFIWEFFSREDIALVFEKSKLNELTLFTTKFLRIFLNSLIKFSVAYFKCFKKFGSVCFLGSWRRGRGGKGTWMRKQKKDIWFFSHQSFTTQRHRIFLNSMINSPSSLLHVVKNWLQFKGGKRMWRWTSKGNKTNENNFPFLSLSPAAHHTGPQNFSKLTHKTFSLPLLLPIKLWLYLELSELLCGWWRPTKFIIQDMRFFLRLPSSHSDPKFF